MLNELEFLPFVAAAFLLTRWFIVADGYGLGRVKAYGGPFINYGSFLQLSFPDVAVNSDRITRVPHPCLSGAFKDCFGDLLSYSSRVVERSEFCEYIPWVRCMVPGDWIIP